MDKNTKQSLKKFERTTNEQLQFYKNCCKSRPELHEFKNDPAMCEQAWRKLAKQLNAIRGPCRTGKQWRQSLSHWRNQLRSRARKAKAVAMMTGESVACADFNEFLHECFDTSGISAVEDKDPLKSSKNKKMFEVAPSPESTDCLKIETTVLSETSPSSHVKTDESCQTSTSKNNKEEFNAEEMMKEVLESLQQRESAQMRAIAETNSILKELVVGVNSIAEALQKFSK